MPCEIDTQTCSGFQTGQGSWQGWVGIHPSDNTGQLCGCCCGIGCKNCGENALNVMHARTDGSRWLRGSRTIFDTHPVVEGDGRDATGKLHNLRIGEAKRVPANVAYDKASCFYQDGLECFDEPNGLCECDTTPGACAPGFPDCPGVGQPCSGRRADAFTYTGFDWLPEGEAFQCKDTTQHGPKPILTGTKELFQGIFIRDDFHQLFKTSGCTANRMVLCGGVNLHLSQHCAWIPPIADPPPIDSHHISPHHQMYNFCTIDYQGLGLDTWGNPSPAEAIARSIKRAALNKVQDIAALSQLDYYPFTFGDSPSGNRYLDSWRRSFGVGVPAEQIIPQTTIAVFENCRLRHSGFPVRAEIFIREAHVAMSLVPYMTFDGVNLLTGFKMYPSARVRIFLVLGIRATILEEEPIVGDIELSIEHPDDYLSPPRVLPLGIDRIVYSDGNVDFIPPTVADWWGYHGEFGVQPWQPIDVSDEPQLDVAKCCYLAAKLDGLEVGPWPTNVDAGGASSFYEGRVKLGFLTSNWGASCGGIPAGIMPDYESPIGQQPSPIDHPRIGRKPRTLPPIEVAA